MEKATSNLALVDLSKHNFHRTLDSLQEKAHSLLLLSIQWKEIEGHFDSTKSLLEEKVKELRALEESLNGRAMELENKEKELSAVHDSFEARVDEFEKMEVMFHSECKEAMERKKAEFEGFTKRIESLEKELQQQRDLRHEFEPLISLVLAKDTGRSSAANATGVEDGLVKRNQALARLIPCLDPAKLVLDAIQGSFKDFGEADVVKSCLVLLEKLIQMNVPITREVNQEATKLGINWISKAKTNQNNDSWVLCCLLFLAAYNLASVTTSEVLLNLLERFLLHDQAPRLFQLLRLQDSVSGVVETLKNKEEYLAVLRFICEFRLYKLCPGERPGSLLQEYLISSDRAARLPFGTGNLMEAQKARREKIKADATMALEIGNPVKGDAKKLAVYWRDKITKNKTDELEVVCFLKFLGIYGIVSEFKTGDLLTLLESSYWQTACPDLCQFLGLDNAITGFIQNLIETGHRFKAVNYIYSFGMVHKFHPVSAIINDSLRITKECAEKAFRDAENEPASQVAAIDRQIRSLRAGIKCITRHKLESEFHLGDLEERIKSLLKLRRNVCCTAEPPSLLAGVGSVSSSSNTRLEHSTTDVSSSASKPDSRGQKRSQSSVHVATHASNHFPEHGYSLNQRLAWPVDHYNRGFNPDYNHKCWIQPEGPPQDHQYYQQYDPYHRNQF
nr:PREDICTED: FRIGIDA-like protein 5 [Raphanus sativus]